MWSRRSLPAAVVGLLVVASTCLRLGVARQFTVPWIAPDEMLYGLLGESLWEHGTLTVRGMASPYYSLLTPALVGAGLELADGMRGVRLAQALQLAAMSSVAIPTYLWARRLAAPWWAVASAAIALAAPALLYGGLLMTEALFYPASVWAAYALAASLERPTLVRQGLFLTATTLAAAVRMQALVLLPVFAVAVVLHPRLGGRHGATRPLWPLACGIGLVAALGVLAALVAPAALGSSELLGAYAGIDEPSEARMGLIPSLVWHAGAVVVASAVVPAIATVLLVIAVRRRSDLAPAFAAFTSTATAFVALLVAQVALFAARHLNHVGQRYVVTAIPVLAIGLVGWVAIGCPRNRRSSLVVAAAAVVLVALLPIVRIAPSLGAHDAVPTSFIRHLADHATAARIGLVGVTMVAAALVLLLPRRLAGALPAIVIAAFALASLDAGRAITDRSAAENRDATGDVDRSWLDHAATGPVTLLVTGDRPWQTEARTVFWNRSIHDVLALGAVSGAVPPSPRRVRYDDSSGHVLDASGRPVSPALVAAPSTVTLEGKLLDAMPVGSATSPPLRLWAPAQPLRVTSRTAGILPNGDFTNNVTVVVPACLPGSLVVTLLGKSGDPVLVWVDGAPRDPVTVPPEESATFSIPGPPGADGSRPCEFMFETSGLVGSTQLVYVPAT